MGKRVEVEVEEDTVTSDGRTGDGVRVTCTQCQHVVECLGTTSR